MPQVSIAEKMFSFVWYMELMVTKRIIPNSIFLALLAVSLIDQNSLAALTQQDVQKLIKDEKTWTNRSGLSVVVNSGEVIIGTYREPQALDNDLKIDSVLITRKIMEADPDVKRVKLRFFDPVSRKSYQQVDVRESDIKAFSQGLVTKEALLGGIDITRGTDSSEIAEGPFATERLAAKRQIDSFRQQGCGVAPFLKMLGTVEELAKETETLSHATETPAAKVEESKASLRKALDDLISHLDAQNDVLKKLKEKQAADKRAAAAAALAKVSAPAQPVRTTASPIAHIKQDQGTGLAQLGPFNPNPGPLLLDRIKIGAQINHIRHNNVPVDHLLPIWVRMEKAARARDEVAVRNDVEYLQKSLGLQPVSEEERRNTTLIRTTPF
jgi:hypothetical protein